MIGPNLENYVQNKTLSSLSLVRFHLLKKPNLPFN